MIAMVSCYGFGCTMLGIEVGKRIERGDRIWPRWPWRKKPAGKALTLTAFDAMIREAYPLSYRDELLSRIGDRPQFSKIKKIRTTEWITPIVMPPKDPS